MRQTLGEIWKMALSPLFFGQNWPCVNATAEKDGDDGKMAASGSASEREQMGRGDFGKGGKNQKEKTELKWRKRQNY